MLPVSSGALSGFFRLINIQEDSLQLLYCRDLRFSFCPGSWEYEGKAEQHEQGDQYLHWFHVSLQVAGKRADNAVILNKFRGS